MDELSILKAQVAILERQMKDTNAQLRKLIEAFEEFRYCSRPFIPMLEEKDEVAELTPMAE